MVMNFGMSAQQPQQAPVVFLASRVWWKNAPTGGWALQIPGVRLFVPRKTGTWDYLGCFTVISHDDRYERRPVQVGCFEDVLRTSWVVTGSLKNSLVTGSLRWQWMQESCLAFRVG